MDSIEFVIKVRDMMSSAFPKMAATAHHSFTKVGKDVADTQRRLDGLSKPVKVRVDTSELEKAKGMMGAIVGGNLLASGISKGAGMVKEFIGSSLDAAMQYSMRVKSFEVMTGSAKRGRELAGELRDLKQSTIIGASVYPNAQTLLGFGLGDNEVVKILRQIGDIAMGDTERMQALTLAYAQVRASGKLMGQDLLQFINAGFNPLSVMAEKWKDFGFKGKKSIGELKDMMSEGKISALQIAKAFELATGKGGKFFNMMEQIGETAGGQAKRLEGTMAAMKIDLGNAFMPIASSFMQAGSDILHWMNISKSAPEQLLGEKFEINTLVDSIMRLNQGTEMRAHLIGTLKSKYPEYFDKLIEENTLNKNLAATLKEVNAAYDTRIRYSTHKTMADVQKHEMADVLAMAQKARAEAGFIRAGSDLSAFTGWEKIRRDNMGIALNRTPKSSADWWDAWAEAAEKKYHDMQGALDANVMAMKRMDINSLISEAISVYSNKTKQSELWGAAATKNNSLLWNELTKYLGVSKGGFNKLLTYDFSTLERLLHGGKVDGSSHSDLLNTVSETSKQITGGGSRQIVINLNKPLIEKIENHVGSIAEAEEVSLRELEEKIMRILQGTANSV